MANDHDHGHGHGHGVDDGTNADAEQFWDAFYREGQAPWSGKPNALLVEQMGGAPAGTALDLGCGQGDDAIWLATQGWRVTGVDVSSAALARAAGRAADAGVTGSITWERHDLAASFPSGHFDLVSAFYLHSPVAVPMSREAILRSAAAALAVGGTLLIVGHAGSPSWVDSLPTVHFPTPDEVYDTLALPPPEWTIERSDVVDVEVLNPSGQPATRPDNILRLHRLG